MKKIFSAIALIILTASSLSAETITLRFSWWGGDARHKPTLKAIKLFEEKHPDITVKGEYSGWGGYPERLTSQIASGSEPDIMQINWAWITAMFSVNGDGFYDINLLKDDIRLDPFGKTIEFGMSHGKLNAVPVSMTGRCFIWQTNTFSKAGVAIPSTWEDLFNAGKTFSEKLGGDYYPIDGQLYDAILMSQAYLAQKTGKLLINPRLNKATLTKEECLELISAFKRLYASHAAVPLAERNASSGTYIPTEQQPDWVKGKWAGNYTWDSTFRTRMSSLPRTTNVTVGPFLKIPGSKKDGAFYRPSIMFAVSKNSKHPHEAAQFIDFILNDPEAIEILGVSRGIPVSQKAYRILSEKTLISPLEKTAAGQLRNLNNDTYSPFFEHIKIQEHMRTVFEKVALNKISDDEAADLLIGGTNDILAKIVPVNFVPEPDNTSKGVQYTGPAGKILSVKGGEITVQSIKGLDIAIGQILYVENGDNPVKIKAAFPMMSHTRCRLESGSLSDIKPGMNVYSGVKSAK